MKETGVCDVEEQMWAACPSGTESYWQVRPGMIEPPSNQLKKRKGESRMEVSKGEWSESQGIKERGP